MPQRKAEIIGENNLECWVGQEPLHIGLLRLQLSRAEFVQQSNRNLINEEVTMSEFNHNNPTGMLAQIVTEAAGDLNLDPNQVPKHETIDVWAKASGYTKDNDLTKLRIYFSLFGLIREAQDQVKSIRDDQFEDQRALYLHALNRVRGVFENTSYKARWPVWYQKLVIKDRRLVPNLENAALAIGRYCSLEPLETEDLLEIKNSLEALLQDIMESSLEPDLKAFLLNSLLAIAEVLDAYQVRSAATFRSLEPHIVGVWMAYREKYNDRAQDESGREIIARVFAALEKIVVIAEAYDFGVTYIPRILDLIQHIPLLPSG